MYEWSRHVCWHAKSALLHMRATSALQVWRGDRECTVHTTRALAACLMCGGRRVASVQCIVSVYLYSRTCTRQLVCCSAECDCSKTKRRARRLYDISLSRSNLQRVTLNVCRVCRCTRSPRSSVSTRRRRARRQAACSAHLTTAVGSLYSHLH